MILIENKVKCVKCNTVVTSVIDTLFKSCSCGHIKISGGNKDLIRIRHDESPAVINEDYFELTTYLLNEQKNP